MRAVLHWEIQDKNNYVKIKGLCQVGESCPTLGDTRQEQQHKDRSLHELVESYATLGDTRQEQRWCKDRRSLHELVESHTTLGDTRQQQQRKYRRSLQELVELCYDGGYKTTTATYLAASGVYHKNYTYGLLARSSVLKENLRLFLLLFCLKISITANLSSSAIQNKRLMALLQDYTVL